MFTATPSARRHKDTSRENTPTTAYRSDLPLLVIVAEFLNKFRSLIPVRGFEGIILKPYNQFVELFLLQSPIIRLRP